MVAAWISADTGVGPSMASSNQDCSGHWADLPQAPSSSSKPMIVAMVGLTAGMPSLTSTNADEPKVASISMIAIDMPRSPTRLTTKAFLAAVAAVGLCCQKPISRYEARPTPSRPTNSSIAALTAGMAISSQAQVKNPVAGTGATTSSSDISVLELQQVGVVDRGRASGSEDGHDDGQADDDLGRRHDHDEEGSDLTVELAVHPGERDQGQVGRVEHQLHAHERDDRVAPDHEADGPDGEQDGGQDDVVVRIHAL